MSQLISPKRSWGTIAAEFLVANESRETLKAFLNTVLAELWKEIGTAPDWEKIYLRKEDYALGIVPAKGLLLVAGVDVQDDRLEVEIKAYGRGKESWSVDYRVIQVPDQAGQPLKTSSPEVWQELEAVLAADWPRESGGTMPIMAMTIDSGYRPQMVYDFAARHPQPAHGPAGDAISAPRTVVVTKGKPDFLKLIASVSPTDASRKRQNVRIWHIGTHWAKQEFYDWLRIVLPDDGTLPARISALRLQGSGLLSRALLRVAGCAGQRKSGVGARQDGQERAARPRGALPGGCGSLWNRSLLGRGLGGTRGEHYGGRAAPVQHR